jgi:hypothetical protein
LPGIFEKLKRSFIYYFEEVEIENLEQQHRHTGHGCH